MSRLPSIALAVCCALAVPMTAQESGNTPAPVRPQRPARPAGSPSARNNGGRPFHNEDERVARWKRVPMPFNKAGLSAREQQMVAKLADACRLLNELYWRESDLGGWAMSSGEANPTVRQLFSINGSRWDMADGNSPFIGEEPMPPGRELYPFGLTRAAVEQYVATHPDEKAAIYDAHTVVRSAPFNLPEALSQPVVYGVPEKLYTAPYHVAFAEWLNPMAEDLRAAAKLSPDPAFAKFLNQRAAALLSADYYESDLAWLDLKNPKVDIIFAPYETYLDGLLGVKGSYGAAILIRNDTESRKLDMYREHEAEMQKALPLPDADKPSKQGQPTPMEVVDAPLRAGDLRYGYQAVADNLPNDPRIHAEKGSKKMFFKNFMDARVNYVVLPVAKKMMAETQAREASAEGYLTFVIMHEISHGLGPAYAHVDGKQAMINEAIGPAYAGLEEAKADITGMFLIKWMADQKLIPAAELDGIYASYLAGAIRSLRFGTADAHGRAQMMEFNYLFERHAIAQGPDGRYTIDYAAMPTVVADLAAKLLTFEAQGDRGGVEAWFAKYDIMPESLTKALEATKGIPIDVTPQFELEGEVRR